jgi:hypothetical protein
MPESPPDKHHLQPLIDKDSDYTLAKFPTFTQLINWQITLKGSHRKPGCTLVLVDPTYAQYAAFMNKPKALAVMFKALTDLSLDDFITPKYSNTKMDLLELAVCGTTTDSFLVILGVISPPFDFIGPSGHTAFWWAIDSQNWDAVTLIFKRIGNPEGCLAALLHRQTALPGPCYCPLVHGLFKHGEPGLLRLLSICAHFPMAQDAQTDTPISILHYAVCDTFWTDKYELDESGSSDKRLWDLFAVSPGGDVGEALAKLAGAVGTLERGVVVARADLPAAPAGGGGSGDGAGTDRNCDGHPDCQDSVSWICPRCKMALCDHHFDLGHTCPP